MRLHEGIDPRSIVGAVAQADAEMLCANCAEKETIYGPLFAIHASGHRCGRCELRFEDAEVFEPGDLFEISVKLMSGVSVIAARHSVGPLHQAAAGAKLGVIADPNGRVVFEDETADVFTAARVFLALVMARQAGYPEDQLRVVAARELCAQDMVYEIDAFDAYLVDGISDLNGTCYVAVLHDRTRRYDMDDPLVIVRNEKTDAGAARFLARGDGARAAERGRLGAWWGLWRMWLANRTL